MFPHRVVRPRGCIISTISMPPAHTPPWSKRPIKRNHSIFRIQEKCIDCKSHEHQVNLIAWNPGPGIAYAMPAAEAVEAFRATLAGEGIPAYVRKPRGRDIFAACGQLKRTVEETESRQ